MSKFTDQQYLKTDQYRDSSNLDARVELHQRFSTNNYGWFKWIFDTLIILPADAKILELGCGHGHLWKENTDRIPATWEITLSDLSSGMLDSAWRKLVVTGRNYKFKEIDAQKVPFEDETFDAVIANHMLYHVPDRAKAISEIKRVLKTGGHIIATTVGKNHMQEINEWLDEISNGNYVSKATLSFTLENGMGQVESFFPQVTLSRYEDNLLVTELEPLVAYIRSMISSSDLQEDKFEALVQDLHARLNQKDEIFITKDSGMFEVIK